MNNTLAEHKQIVADLEANYVKSKAKISEDFDKRV
jgi:hypothetical protein